MDETPRRKGGFKIKINGKQVTYKDRQELKNLEFIWEFGEATLPDRALPRDIERFVLTDDTVDEAKGWSVTGWIGTARTPSDLTEDEEAGSLKNIIVLARKRPIQEGIIDKLDFSRIFGNYVTGQIRADFLDLEGEDDIATSDRQRLIEDDPRVTALQRFLRDAFLTAADQWTEHRPKRKAKKALDDHPELKEWVEGLAPWQRGAANKMIGTIAALPMERGNEKANRGELYRSGVLAFARIGLRETSEKLDMLGDVRAEQLLELLGAQDEYETALWGDILRSRVDAIRRFENLTATNQKEHVLRDHLFDHLWLLDPSWERATGSNQMEQALSKIDPDNFPEDRDGNEIRGRVDIRYATAAGVHIIVELKRYSVTSKLDVILEQGEKYHEALSSVLEKQNVKNPKIEVVFVLGSKPTVGHRGKFGTDDEFIAHSLVPITGRYALYDELIGNTRRQYEEYFGASLKARELNELLDSLL